ncbi:MAG: hypothetical protein ACI4O7_09440 [Aristaeellaceae bacterium]
MTPEVWRLRGDENMAMRAIAAALNLFTDRKLMGALERRIDAVPPMRRELEAVTRMTEDLLSNLCLTVPPEQRTALVRNLAWQEITVGVRAAASAPEYCLVRLNDLQTLTDYALRAECYLCDKSEGQARACPLRAALDGCTVHTLPRYRGCSYRGASVEEGTPWPQPPQINHEERKESP